MQIESTIIRQVEFTPRIRVSKDITRRTLMVGTHLKNSYRTRAYLNVVYIETRIPQFVSRITRVPCSVVIYILKLHFSPYTLFTQVLCETHPYLYAVYTTNTNDPTLVIQPSENSREHRQFSFRVRSFESLLRRG